MANIKIAELTTPSIELNENQVANVVGGFRRRGGVWINDSFNKQVASNYSDVFQLNLGYYGGNHASVYQSASNSIY